MQVEQDRMASIIPVEKAKTLDGLFKERVQRSPQKVGKSAHNGSGPSCGRDGKEREA